MEGPESEEFVSIGAFSPPEATRLLETLVANGIEPQIEVDDGIRNVSVRRGSDGMMAKVEVFVAAAELQRAYSIRDQELKLMGEV